MVSLVFQNLGKYFFSKPYLEYAAGQKSAVLTHNRTDFEDRAQEYFKQGRLHYGIIIAVRNPYQEIVQRLLTILNSTTADEMENQILYI